MLTLTLLLTLAVTRADLPCPPPDDGNFERITAWVRAIDYLRDAFPLKPAAGDYLTPFGTILDQKCFAGLTPEQTEAKKKHFLAALSHALTQSKRCWERFRLVDASGALTRLRRTRVFCEIVPGATAAANQFVLEGGRTLPAGNSQHYDMLGWDGSKDDNVDEAAATLFHEALHWGIGNNRCWHSTLDNKTSTGCDRSIFEDRVHLTEAACFPNSSRGKQFYKAGGPHSCVAPNNPVCQNAFLQSDPGLSEFHYEKFISDKATSRQEAAGVCEKIREYAAERRKFEQERRVLGAALGVAIDSITRAPHGADSSSLAAKLKRVQELTSDGLRGLIPPARALAEIAPLRAQAEAWVAAQCQQGRPRPKYCAASESPMAAYLRGVTEKLSQVQASDLVLDRAPAAVP